MIYRFTINTDASWDPRSKLAGWAYWIKSDHYAFSDSGSFADPLPTNHVAELMAIELAIQRIIELIYDEKFLQYHLEQNNIVLTVNTDSKWSISALTCQNTPRDNKQHQGRVRKLAEPFTMDLRHVKAHTHNPAARSWVNRWCDRAARQKLRERVRLINGNEVNSHPASS